MKQTDSERSKIKKIYRRYWIQLVFRILVLLSTARLAYTWPQELMILEGMNFFKSPSPFHILWLLWAWYMVEKLLPAKFGQHRGSMKYQKAIFSPTREYERRKGKDCSWEEWRGQQGRYQKGAAAVFLVWAAVGLVIFWLHRQEILGYAELLVLTAFFYVSDLVCILIWCPFRHFLMKNRCCTQCRIYNWDTWMMIMPLLSVRGFFTYSLLALAVCAAGLWEVKYLLHPERYYALTNRNLGCASCKGQPGCYQVRKREPLWWFLQADREK